jgi:hypothetical protein
MAIHIDIVSELDRRAIAAKRSAALAARSLEQTFEKSGTTAGEGFAASMAAGLVGASVTPTSPRSPASCPPAR